MSTSSGLLQEPQIADRTPAIRRGKRLPGQLHDSFAFAALFVLVLILQICSGAYRAEFGAYPDEASHYLSGLLIHDYAAHGFPQAPMTFARNFYSHYSYLALGHWPPFFYSVEGAWMLLFSTSRTSVLLLMAVITTALATVTFGFLRRQFGSVLAMAMAAILVSVPLMQQYTSMVMLDSLLALLSLCAVLSFGSFVKTGRVSVCVAYVLFSVLAILTKGNGFDLALVPPATLLLTRQFQMFKRLSFWLSSGLIAAASLPWHFVTRNLMLPTFQYEPGWKFTTTALAFYGRTSLRSLGSALLIVASIGIWERCARAWRLKCADPQWAALGSFLLALVGFHSIVSGGLEVRYFVPAVAPVIIFVGAGIAYIARRFSFDRWEYGTAVGITACLFAAQAFSVSAKSNLGFTDVARTLAGLPGFPGSVTLVSSETDIGEGVLVSEVAMLGQTRTPTVLRASKVLADDDWNVSSYRARFDSASSVGACLDRLPISYLVLDESPGRRSFTHHRQLRETVSGPSSPWRLIGAFGDHRQILVYSSLRHDHFASPQPAAVLDLDLSAKNRWAVSMHLACPSDPTAVHDDLRQ